VKLLAFAAERRAAALCCGVAHTALSSKPAARLSCAQMMGQTDGRTDGRLAVL